MRNRLVWSALVTLGLLVSAVAPAGAQETTVTPDGTIIGPYRNLQCDFGIVRTNVAPENNIDQQICDLAQRGPSPVPAPTTQEPVVPTNRPATCGGKKVTIYGTPGDDRITGTDGADVIHGLQGHDHIRGLDGNDTICGGAGHDLLTGGQGFDVLYGAQGNDHLSANGSGRDDIAGSRMFGGAGHDKLVGSNRWDRMQGGPGNDTLTHGPGSVFDQGRDWMRGGPGNDHLFSRGFDDLAGGTGHDHYNYDTAAEIQFSQGNDTCYAWPIRENGFDETLKPDLTGCEEWIIHGVDRSPKIDGRVWDFVIDGQAGKHGISWHRKFADQEATGGQTING